MKTYKIEIEVQKSNKKFDDLLSSFENQSVKFVETEIMTITTKRDTPPTEWITEKRKQELEEKLNKDLSVFTFKVTNIKIYE